MDPVSAATTFATLVSLLGDFVSQRASRQSASHEEFLEWLSEHRHADLVSLIKGNDKTTIAIKVLLDDSREVILDKLGELDRAIASLPASMSAYEPLAAAAYPSGLLSAQAVSIIEQLYDSSGDAMIEIKFLTEDTALLVSGGSGGNIRIEDHRFLNDDLGALVEFGLVDLGFNSKGGRVFSIKRSAAAFVQQQRRANNSLERSREP